MKTKVQWMYDDPYEEMIEAATPYIAVNQTETDTVSTRYAECLQLGEPCDYNSKTDSCCMTLLQKKPNKGGLLT